MERSIFYGKRIIHQMELCYYIIVTDISQKYCDLESYGVKIEKTVYSKGGGKSIQSSQINNIFYKQKDIEKFMDLIINNEVTPISLKDVVEDYIVDCLDKHAAAV